ncbi:methylenetetrahydrofolate reductase [Saccharomonospora iraqiensis]|uniref:methylenetetrahydrofolate reductase n=1 Tax=Saccharomonospora iraqiensis TaxID=52698 RepID=UPI00041A0521|nr:methylenetetrahydrofolate reductase [Saccharomonospora iraqiensis]
MLRRQEPGGRATEGLRALGPALDRVRYEVLPLTGVLEQTAMLPERAVVTVTSSPSKDIEATLEVCEKLTAQRLHAVPHLAARQLRDAGHLREVLDRIEGADIREVFVVGGDVSDTGGAFPDGLALLRAMTEAGRRPARVGVPSYPEGHPSIPDEALWRALRDKQDFADYTVTQMCFDATAVCRFIGRAREHGITLPVVVGLPGAVEVGKLLTVGARIGVGDSLRFVRANRSTLGRLARPRNHRPGDLLARLGTRGRDEGCDVAGLHFYTFNRVGATARWVGTTRRRVE